MVARLTAIDMAVGMTTMVTVMIVIWTRVMRAWPRSITSCLAIATRSKTMWDQANSSHGQIEKVGVRESKILKTRGGGANSRRMQRTNRQGKFLV